MPYTNAGISADRNTAGFTAAAVTNQKTSNLNAAARSISGGGTVGRQLIDVEHQHITFTTGRCKCSAAGSVNWDSVVWGPGPRWDFGANTGYLHSSWQQVFAGTSQITASNGRGSSPG